MQIANPIYDVVFKYMMEDNKVAKIFLSALTGFDILELDFMPQELSGEVGKDAQKESQLNITVGLSIYRIDFSAKIQTSEGEKLIIIELQKTKLTDDIPRFRQYLGKQYMNRDFFVWLLSNQGRIYKSGIPIFPIFILGKGLAEYKGTPVLLVDSCIKDRYNQEILGERGDFIPSLFHKGMIINIPDLRKKRRDELETLLSIFDQTQIDESHHIMNINEDDFPEKYRAVIRRLQKAVQTQDVRAKMQIEDDYMSSMQEVEEKMAKLQKENEVLAQENAYIIFQKKEAEKREQQAQQERQEAEKREQQAHEIIQKSVLMMNNLGVSVENIAQSLGITEENVRFWLQK